MISSLYSLCKIIIELIINKFKKENNKKKELKYLLFGYINEDSIKRYYMN